MENASKLVNDCYIANSLCLNIDKMQDLEISCSGGTKLKVVNLSGFSINSKLNWKKHIQSFFIKFQLPGVLISLLRCY